MKLLNCIWISFFLTFQSRDSQCYLFPIASRLLLGGQAPPPDSVWPRPQVWQNSSTTFAIDPTTFNLTANTDCDIIERAKRRYFKLIFKEVAKLNTSSSLKSIVIDVKNHSCGYPHLDQDESYQIKIDSTIGRIEAAQVWGALKALETFSQLVYRRNSTYLVNKTTIQDWPRYKYRGIMLDTARHFIPKSVLLKNLDAMAYNKFNAFHWHITDDQSFPLVISRYPNLTEKCAYSPKHVYNRRDVVEIIEYARLRGIRVIPEIDTPGHTYAIGRAFPHLLSSCYGKGPNKPDTPNYPQHAEKGPLDPTKNATFEFMANIFKELRQIFVDDYIHLGMDEVYYKCWESSPEIKTFMKQHNMKNLTEVEKYYMIRVMEVASKAGFKQMAWQDPADKNIKLEKDTLVEVWRGKANEEWKKMVKKMVQQGNQVVFSSCWYLSHLMSVTDWQVRYECDPRTFGGSKQQQDLVIGGEACVWGEFVDATNLMARLWPRGSAVGERLWSSVTHTRDINSTRLRLDQHRCLMLSRNVAAGPVHPGYCDEELD